MPVFFNPFLVVSANNDSESEYKKKDENNSKNKATLLNIEDLKLKLISGYFRVKHLILKTFNDSADELSVKKEQNLQQYNVEN